MIAETCLCAQPVPVEYLCACLKADGSSAVCVDSSKGNKALPVCNTPTGQAATGGRAPQKEARTHLAETRLKSIVTSSKVGVKCPDVRLNSMTAGNVQHASNTHTKKEEADSLTHTICQENAPETTRTRRQAV